VVVVVVVQQGVRWRCADSVAVRVDLDGVRWLGVPGLEADAGVQHAGVPRQLRCGRVVHLVDLFQDMRRRCPIAVAPYHDATGVRRIAVPGRDADASVQHSKLPHQLRRRWLVGVVGVHSNVWRWHSETNACHCCQCRIRRQGVPGAVADPELQHPAVRRQLRGQWLVDLVGVLSQVRRWCPDADAHRHPRRGLRRLWMPRVAAVATVQHATVPLLEDGWLVDLQQAVRWRCDDACRDVREWQRGGLQGAEG